MVNKWNPQNLEKIVKESNTKTEVLTKLNLNINNHGNFDTLNRYLKLFNIDVSHFNYSIFQNNVFKKRYNLEDILMENSTYASTPNLKEKLYKKGLKERKCEKCGQGENWHGEHISLILDHINGINNDNRFENLRILCPNCNATLPTHCGKNIKNKKIKTIKPKKIKVVNKCEKCGTTINNKNGNKSKYCETCYHINSRTIERPSYEQLLVEIKTLGYLDTGRKYGVSDNAIRKWIKYYEKYER